MGCWLSCAKVLALGAGLLWGPSVVHSYDKFSKLESARLYGDVGNFEYYFLDLLVGSPDPQRTSVIVDTGSAICSFPCSACSSGCGKHLDEAFDVSKSSSFKWLGCNEGCSGTCRQGRCSYHQRYQEDGSVTGAWFEDYVRLGDAFQHNPPVKGRMGCHLHETKLFYSQKANGIFGMAPRRSNTPTIFEVLLRDRSHISAQIFAMCLSEHGGLLTIGGYNKSLHVGATGRPRPITWVRMTSDTTYRVHISALRLQSGNEVARNTFGKTFVDSGTTHTHFPSGTYRKLLREIKSHCELHDRCGGATLQGNSCWNIPDQYNGLKHFPVLEVVFESGKSVSWRPQAYLYRPGDSKKNTFCAGFQDNGHISQTVLGATWMLHSDVIFDIPARRLGIVEARCPEHRLRPPPPEHHHPERASLSKLISARLSSTSIGGFATALLLVLVAGGLIAVLRNLHAACQRARNVTVVPAVVKPCQALPALRYPQRGRGPSGQAGKSGPEPGPRVAGSRRLPLEMWLHAGCCYSSGSDGSSEAPPRRALDRRLEEQ